MRLTDRKFFVLKKSRAPAWIALLIAAALLAGCALTLRDQPRLEPFEASAFFADGAAMRLPPADTVARGQLALDEHLHNGRVGGTFAPTFPYTVTLEMMERGRERYDIFCTPCHGATGDGKGIITQYGMREPTSFHDEGVRTEPPGYYFDLITNGTRVMPPYGSRIPPEDRWAIIAYIRALQLSQHADASELSPDDLQNLD
jgi:mono/diheme cytochrome c family protein